MKISVIFIALFLGIAFGSVAQKSDKKIVCFKSSMDCADCEITLTENLKFEKGVKDLKIDHVSNTILIEYKEGKNTDEDLAKVIEKKGYKADKITKDEYEKLKKSAAENGHDHQSEAHKEK